MLPTKNSTFLISYFGNKCLKRLIRRQNYYTKLLKLVSVKKKMQKKCTFFQKSAFFREIYSFFTSLLFFIGIFFSFAIHLVCFFGLIFEYLNKRSWFYYSNICSVGTKFLNKIKSWCHKIFKVSVV